MYSRSTGTLQSHGVVEFVGQGMGRFALVVVNVGPEVIPSGIIVGSFLPARSDAVVLRYTHAGR